MLDFTKENIFIKRLSVATKDKFTFDFNDKAYYFKTCANMSQKEMSRSILNEVLISHIARKCGMNCVESHLAKVNRDGKTLIGVLTPSFCEEGFDRASLQVFLKPYFLKQRQEAQSEDEKRYWSQRMVDILYDNNVEDSLNAISLYLNEQGFDKQNYNAKEIESIKEGLANTAILDFLTLNEDRHSDNIEILVPQLYNKSFLKLAPIFDNERSFLGDDDAFDFVTFRIDGKSSKMDEKTYAKQINNFVKTNKLTESKNSIEKIKNLNIKQEIVECLSNEFECNKNIDEILNCAGKLGLDLSVDDLKEKANVFSHQQSLLKENCNVNS